MPRTMHRLLSAVLPAAFWADLELYERRSQTSLWKILALQEPVWVLFTFRLGQALRARRLPLPLKLLALPPIVLLHHRVCLLTGIQLPLATCVAPGLHISHFGGIVINGNAELGPNCFLNHGVTIGYGGHGTTGGVPRLGRAVYVGSGAQIIGAITVGDAAIIGANAVVTKDVPPRAIMVGIPARNIGSREPEDWRWNATRAC